jgi:hypothetical protein
MTRQKTMTMREKHVFVHFHECNPKPGPGLPADKCCDERIKKKSGDIIIFIYLLGLENTGMRNIKTVKGFSSPAGMILFRSMGSQSSTSTA